MPTLPTELVTLLGSSLLSGVMKLFALNAAAKRQERLLHMQALNQSLEHIARARKFDRPGFQWTRRLIAITATFFIIAFPKIVAVWMPEVPVLFGYPDLDKGLWLWSASVERIEWVQINGLVITPLDTHLLSAIVGMYFGGSLAAHK